MSLLEKLWDDTVAGPRPDSGLGKLRKYNTFTYNRPNNSTKDGRSYGGDESAKMGDEQENTVKVTRSIMIMKPQGYNNMGSGSAPVSPVGSISPRTPTSSFSGNRSGAFRFRRNSTSDAYEKATNNDGARGTPPPQDV